MRMQLTLSLLPATFAICRLDGAAQIPAWGSLVDVGADAGLVSITRTPDELTIVCPQHHVPDGIQAERDWRCIRVAGPLDLALTGVLASLAEPLAQARISIFAVSTYDTDYLMVKDKHLDRAMHVLLRAGHRVVP